MLSSIQSEQAALRLKLSLKTPTKIYSSSGRWG